MRILEIIANEFEPYEEFTSREVLDCWSRIKICPNDRRRMMRPTDKECCRIVSGISELVKTREPNSPHNVYYKTDNFKYDERDLQEIIDGDDDTLLKRS